MQIAQFNFFGGDSYLCNQKVIELKKKSGINWTTLDLSEENFDQISSIVFSGSLFEEKRGYILKGLKSNKKFLSNIENFLSNENFYILWDNDANIYTTGGKTAATWKKLINDIESSGGLFIFPFALPIKDNNSLLYVMNEFQKKSIMIDKDAAYKILEFSGENTAFVQTEILKFCSLGKSHITIKDVVAVGYDSENPPLFYLLTDKINDMSVIDSYALCLQLVKGGINSNVIIDMLMKRQRWIILAAQILNNEPSIKEATDFILKFGHHTDLKKKEDYLNKIKELGFVLENNNITNYNVTPEYMMWRFMAEKLVDYVLKIKSQYKMEESEFYLKFTKKNADNYKKLLNIYVDIRKNHENESLLFDAVVQSCSQRLKN